MKSRWQFSALDTWFFRESRPMESIGGSELQSGFPPSPRTVAGAIRYLVGQKHEVDWSEWNKPSEYPALKKLMGDASSYGDLRFNGPWLVKKTPSGASERLYPAPANLVAARDEQGVHSPVRLVVGSPRHCDLGQFVRMAEVAPADQAVADKDDLKLKALSSYWITSKTLQSILAGNRCDADALIPTSSLFESESRLGIARSNITRTVEQGMLYQTKHVRPAQNILLEVDVKGLSDTDYETSGVVRLGGEGRGAAYQVESVVGNDDLTENSDLPISGSQADKARGVMLVLLTPFRAPTNPEGYSPLPGFERVEEAGRTVWKGSIENIALSVYCSVQVKAVREGGWDLANNRPREVQSLVPAGSVFYASVDNGDIPAAIAAIHQKQLGGDKDDVALGRGLVAAGVWPNNEWVEKE